MSNIDSLYRQVIMEHYKSPHNKGLLEDETYKKVHLNNPSCGDDIFVQVKVMDDVIVDVRHDGKGCSICCSSASVLSDAIKGKRVEEAEKIIGNFLTMIKGEEFDEDIDMGDALVYQGVAQFPARIKCATLSWKAMIKALNEEEDNEK